MKKFKLALIALTTFPTIAIADEDGDIKECADLIREVTGESFHNAEASWEPRFFGPNRVEFSRESIVCDVGVSGVVNLSRGSTIFIQDGWPLGREQMFVDLEDEIEGEKERLRAQIDALEDLQELAEEQLSEFSNDPQ